MSGYQDDEQKVQDIIHKIQIYALPRRLRTLEFFKNFDSLRCGRVTKVQFGRAVNTLGLRFDDADIMFLAEHFTEDGPRVQAPQVVNYKKFCEACDKIYNDEDLSFKDPEEIKNQEDAMYQSMMRMSATSFLPQDVEEEERMDHIMHRVATLCKSRGIVFKYLFTDFERGSNASPSRLNPTRSGKVTKNQFCRILLSPRKPFKKDLSDEDVELLCRRYSTEAGDVHFQAIHNDISEVLSPEPPEFPTSPLVLKPDGTKWDHQTLNPVAKIQSKVVERRIRLGDMFRDFDPLRKGFCTAGQLKTVLTISDLAKEIDRNDFNHIIEIYSREDGMFCYHLFCKDIDSAFMQTGLEKDPLAETSMPDHTTTAPGRRNRIKLGSGQMNSFNALEDKIRSRVYKRRILMKPTFLDMDKAHKGLVTRNQFHRCMGSIGFELSPEEVSILASVYCDRGNHNDFNYVDFIKACDPPIEQEEIAMSQLNAPYQDQAPSKYFDGMRVRPLDRAFSPLVA